MMQDRMRVQLKRDEESEQSSGDSQVRIPKEEEKPHIICKVDSELQTAGHKTQPWQKHHMKMATERRVSVHVLTFNQKQFCTVTICKEVKWYK